MDREAAKKLLLKSVDKEIKKHGEDAIAMMSPRRGKCSWTWKEYKEAIINDTSLAEIDDNPIDDILNFNKYLIEKRGYGLKKEDDETEINS